MKRKTAKEILAESFRELAETKSIDKITIKEITENCGYSTATFYRQFKDKYDLIAWDYTRDVERIMSRVDVEVSTWRETLYDAARYLDDRREYLGNLFLHTVGYDSFIEYMKTINFAVLRDVVLRASGLSELDEKTEMYIRIYVLGTVQLSCEWILGKYTVSPNELAEVFENSLPVPLRKYLMEIMRESELNFS